MPHNASRLQVGGILVCRLEQLVIFVRRMARCARTPPCSTGILTGERWESGRARPPRKREYLYGYREFESPPLRQPSLPVHSAARALHSRRQPPVLRQNRVERNSLQLAV